LLTEFGGYRIQEVLGEGGMAVVYKAYEPRLDRVVALKVMHRDDDTDATYLARFRREARAAARMQHPNIVTVYAAGEQDGQPYIAMEYVDGGTVLDRMREGPLDPAEAVWIAGQIADALDYAHRQGFVHRDVKPANILLSHDGKRAVLSDFGVVRPIVEQQGAALTAVGLTVGTPDYMSPEQAMAEPLDGRSDLYSLGVVLYHLLTGRRPFTAGSLTSMVADMLSKDPQSPRQVNPRISPHLEAAMLKVLAPARDQRFQTGAEFKQALETALEEGRRAPLPAPPRAEAPPASFEAARPVPAAPISAPVRQNRLPLIVGGVALGIIVLALLVCVLLILLGAFGGR
jgi:serine/threonine-protein kinase